MLSDQSLDTIRARTEAAQPPGWAEEYGDEAWKAAMALIGLEPMSPRD